MRKNKKGDLTSKWIVIIVLLLIGFGILLFFILRFTWQENIDREVCHESVILRATMPSIAKGYIPLKCKTAKFCITTGMTGGKCDDEGEAFRGEKGITKVKVKSKEDMERFIAREIIDCWSMMGKGKIGIVTDWMAEQFGIGEVTSSCTICSRIAFDEKKLKEKGIDYTKIDIFNYSLTHKAPGKEVSYFDYIAGEKGKMQIKEELDINKVEEKLSKISVIEKTEGEEVKYEETTEGEKLFGQLEEKEEEDKTLAVLFMQIRAPSHSGVLKNTLYAGAFSLPVTGTAFKLSSRIPGARIIMAIGVALGLTYQQINVVIQKGVTAGYCGDISVGNEAREGCSVVRTMDYNVDDLIKYCSVIESIP
jgi:hypothetical protein